MTFLVVIAILVAAALLCLAMSVYWAARAIAEAKAKRTINDDNRSKLPTTRANVPMPAVNPPANKTKTKEATGE